MYYLTNDASYWYEVYGKGIPLVMLHGFTGSTKTWEYFIEHRNPNIQMIVIDLPGHGKTTTQNPKTMETCCSDLHQLFQYLGLNNFHLLGYSMGGRTALSFASLYPDSVNSLILESASPGLETAQEQRIRIQKDEDLASKLESDGIEAFVDFWENIPLFASQKKLPELEQQSIRTERLNQSEQGLAESLRYMGTGIQPSCWHILGKMEIPVLLLVGELDEKFVTINKKMKDNLLHSKLIIFENAGHAIHVEVKREFVRQVIEFIL